VSWISIDWAWMSCVKLIPENVSGRCIEALRRMKRRYRLYRRRSIVDVDRIVIVKNTVKWEEMSRCYVYILDNYQYSRHYKRTMAEYNRIQDMVTKAVRHRFRIRGFYFIVIGSALVRRVGQRRVGII